MDPLSLVRDFNVDKNSSKIRLIGEQVDFDGKYLFPKSCPTAFKAGNVYCTLEVVLNVLNTRTLSQPEYLKQCAASKFYSLPFADRKVRADIGISMLACS